MKIWLSIVFTWFISITHAQNFNCLQSGIIPYFTNNEGYLKAMRIDSIQVMGTDTLYFPFHTPRIRYECAGISTDTIDYNGGSWLGKKVVKHNDGIWEFDNFWGDTIFINSQANIGDSWIFYNDSSIFSYKATVLNMDTATILGYLDSIKIIEINAYQSGALAPHDPINGIKIQLSKNSGFYRVADLFTFPYHRTESLDSANTFFDIFHDKIIHSNVIADLTCYPHILKDCENQLLFKRIDFHVPTNMEIFDFSVGDRFKKGESIGMFTSRGTYDSIMTKTVSTYSYNYDIYRIETISSGSFVGGIYTVTTTTSSTTFHRTYDTSKAFPMDVLPEENGTNFLYYFKPDTSSCHLHKYTIEQLQFYFSIFPMCYVSLDMGLNRCFSYYGFNRGAGETHYGYYSMGMAVPNDCMMGYIEKGGTVCTGGFRMAIEDPTLENKMVQPEVFPNPTTGEFELKSKLPISDIKIYNIMGQELFHISDYKPSQKLNLIDYPHGIYFIRINNTYTTRLLLK